MNSESVDLIATDPPFNKGRDFHATPDSLAKGAKFQDRWSWKEDVQQDWVDQITDDYPPLMEAIESARYAHSDGMGAFMCFMAVRLLEMRRVLKDTGSIYLHCDPTAAHYLKAVMDAIFGHKNFKNEIIWRRTGSHGNPKRWGPVHDTILFCTKSAQYTWNWPKQPYMRGHVKEHFVKNEDGDGYRTAYYGNVLTGSGLRGGLSGKPWRGINPSAKNRHWAIPGKLWEESGLDDDGMTQHDKLDALYDAGLIRIEKGSAWPIYERSVRPDDGPATNDIWAYQPYTEGSVYGVEVGIDDDVSWLKTSATERTGFETQKPLALYERIIRASSKQRDIVCDPFAGCATTCVAAERLGRQWVGIDIWEKAHEVVIERLKNEGLLQESAGKSTEHLAFGDIHYATEPPERTDGGETAAPFLQVTEKRKRPPLEPWQKLPRGVIVQELTQAQSVTDGLALCAGCGRELEAPFMELDHIVPRSDRGENDISNRILLCRPCNGRKSAKLTMTGLIKENKKAGWLKNQKLAKHARDLAQERYEEVRYRRPWPATTPDLFD